VPGAGNPQNFNRYSYANNNPLNYTDPSGHFAIPVVIAVVVVALKVIDYGWTAIDTVNYLSVAFNSTNASAVRKEALGNAAVAVAMEFIEPDELSPVAVPLDDIVRHGDDIGEFIYKKGSNSFDNVTPRPGIDDKSLEKGGLSFWDSIESLRKNMGLEPEDKIITVDPKQVNGLDIIKDNDPPGHISIRPSTLPELQEWASTRRTNIVHRFTQTVRQSIVDVRKWKDWLK
jgi:hypothetical protein